MPLLAAAVLAVALAYTEAAVVVNLRAVIAPLREVHCPRAVDEVVPMLTLQQLEDAGGRFPHLLATEVGREMTPIVVLLAMAWGMARTWRQFAGLFILGFGVWDIFYYAWLRALIGWPSRLATWDVLFLIPAPWVAPVWAPMLVAATLTGGGIALVLRRRRGARGRRALAGWLAAAAGSALVVTSFFLRAREAFVQTPGQFDWPWFLLGWAIGTAGVAWLIGAPAASQA